MVYILFIVKVIIIAYTLHKFFKNRVKYHSNFKRYKSSKNELNNKSELKEYQKLLGIGNKLDIESLRAAYHKQVKKNHPDLFQQERDKIKATQKMLRINVAYQILTEYIKNKEGFTA